MILCCSRKSFNNFPTPCYLKLCFKTFFSENKARPPKFQKKIQNLEKLRNLTDPPKSAKHIWGANLYVLVGYSV